MRPIEYIRVGICIVAVICWARVAVAANLKDIRLGEHKAFTRIVFEFDSTSSYRMPKIEGDGIASVVFPDSSGGAVRPLKDLREKYRFINAVELVKKERNLTARIIAHSQSFEIRSFSLTNPDRVVLDFYWSYEKLAAPVIVAEQPTDQHEPTAIVEEPVSSKGVEIEETAANGSRQPDPAPQISQAEQAAETMAPTEKSVRKTIPDVIRHPAPSIKYDKIQMALMILLVVLNVVIVAILAILVAVVLKWRRGNALSERETISTLLDDNIISIDTKIQEELKKYKRTR